MCSFLYDSKDANSCIMYQTEMSSACTPYTNSLKMKQLFTKGSCDHGELINLKLSLLSYFSRK